MVFLLIFFLPYTVALLFGSEGKQITVSENKEKENSAKENEMCMVSVLKPYGVELIPLEEYLIGSLAASIPGEYHLEAVKAQAVILRSGAYEKILSGDAGAASEDGVYQVQEEALGQPYLEQPEREKLWGENFPEFEEKFRQAAESTRGLVIRTDENLVNPPFFRLSNGQTRSSQALKYIKSVPCEQDIAAKEQLETKEITIQKFLKTLQQNGINIKNMEKIQLEYDQEDYVKQLRIGETAIDGESFRKIFLLQSPSFFITQNKEKLVIKTKGIGHGFGLSQYMAQCMAAKEDDFLTILHYFYQNIDIEKIV